MLKQSWMGQPAFEQRNMNTFQGWLSQPSTRTKKVKMSPEEKEDDLDSTDDGESSEESHCASYKTQLTLKLDLRVSFYLVIGSGVKEDMDELNGRIWYALYVRYSCWAAKSNISHESPLIAQISFFDYLELLTLGHIMFGHISV